MQHLKRFMSLKMFPQFLATEFPQKTALWDNFPVLSPIPNPLQNAKFVSNIVSPSLKISRRRKPWKCTNSRLLSLSQVPLDTCLDSPLLCQPLSSLFAPHGLRTFEFLHFHGASRVQ